jgi:hypothetical protein
MAMRQRTCWRIILPAVEALKLAVVDLSCVCEYENLSWYGVEKVQVETHLLK